MNHRMDFKSVTINGKGFVSGLLWQPLQRPRAYMAEAREIGKADGMDIVAIRTGQTMIQAGFVKKGNGIGKGMYSLASALAGLIDVDAWIGAFQLPDGQYALVAVHQGLIVPGCDLIGDKQQIRNLLLEKDSQVRGLQFDKVFHPDDFEWRGEPLEVESVLTPGRLKKEFALKQLAFGLSKNEVIAIASVVIVLVISAIATQQWFAYQDQLAREEAARQAAIEEERLARLRAEAGENVTAQALAHPWASKPTVHDFLTGCQGAINALPLALGGWEFVSAICTTDAFEMVYARPKSGPSFAQFAMAAADRFSSPAMLLDGGDRAGLGDQVTLPAGGDEELHTKDELQSLFTSHMQKLELKPSIAEVPYIPPVPTEQSLPGEPEQALPPTPDWKTFSYSFDTDYSPETVFGAFNLDGVRLTEITVARSVTSQLTWSFKGEMYAR